MKRAFVAPALALSPIRPHTRTARHNPFACLTVRNYRLYIGGQLISFTGSWVQRITQDWLVLTLTGSVTAVGVTVALQQVPTLLFGLLGGVIADRFPRRRVLQVTQSASVATSAVLGYLALTNQVTAWHVYVVAFVLGVNVALDNPSRQAFVNEMVGPAHLRAAIGLHSAVFQLGALIGPAISGLLIDVVGPGSLFAGNAGCAMVPIVLLGLMRPGELNRGPVTTTGAPRLREALHAVVTRPALRWPTILVGIYAMFTLNLAVTLASYAQSVFHSGASGYGLLSSLLAVGAVAGALISMRLRHAGLATLTGAALTISAFYLASAAALTQWSLGILLIGVGAATLLLYTLANSMVQMGAGDGLRGRVMGVYLLVFSTTGALGGPVVGAIDEHFGPRIGLLLAAVVPGAATLTLALARRRRRRKTQALASSPDGHSASRRSINLTETSFLARP